ncbi:sigma-70 family RNA polymerase sigma factor [Planctomycetales bacterium ZRK34]|nr:sigma-70 family RNA polymerase sigma factor [Planctomycetales bacterium ZRK34]
MPESPRNDDFLQQLIGCQDRLCAYATALMGSPGAAEDLVQQANLVIWRRAEDFEPGTEFGAWACRILYYEVLAWRKKQSRDRLVFDDAVLAQLAEDAEAVSETAETRRRALNDCINRLSDTHRRLLSARYESTDSMSTLAQQLGRPIGSLYQTLRRVRIQLAGCVQRYLNREQCS